MDSLRGLHCSASFVQNGSGRRAKSLHPVSGNSATRSFLKSSIAFPLRDSLGWTHGAHAARSRSSTVVRGVSTTETRSLSLSLSVDLFEYTYVVRSSTVVWSEVIELFYAILDQRFV